SDGQAFEQDDTELPSVPGRVGEELGRREPREVDPDGIGLESPVEVVPGLPELEGDAELDLAPAGEEEFGLGISREGAPASRLCRLIGEVRSPNRPDLVLSLPRGPAGPEEVAFDRGEPVLPGAELLAIELIPPEEEVGRALLLVPLEGPALERRQAVG